MGDFVHGVSPSHEARWVAHGIAMRHPGGDQAKIVVLFAMKYPTRTNQADQNEVPQIRAMNVREPEK